MNIILKIKSTLLSSIFFLIGRNQLHQISKFKEIFNIWANIYLDKISGDYIEFGILNGKSLRHSFQSYKKIFKDVNINFHGLDSFSGFPVENHNFYIKKNFENNYEKVLKTFNKSHQIKIYDGFFSDTLKEEFLLDKKFSFAFIDCDIYESANDAFAYLKSRMVNGGFLMIDDFTSLDENGNSIYKSFINHFEIGKNVILFSTYSNGHVYRFMEDN